MKKLNKSGVIAQIQRQFGPDANFVANVILTQHKNPARKLQGLLTLLVLGHDVRIAQCDITRLMVNDQPWTWTELECGDDYLKALLAKLASNPQPVVTAAEQSDPDDLSHSLADDPTYYEDAMARKTGSTVEQMRKEQAQAEAEQKEGGR